MMLKLQRVMLLLMISVTLLLCFPAKPVLAGEGEWLIFSNMSDRAVLGLIKKYIAQRYNKDAEWIGEENDPRLKYTWSIKDFSNLKVIVRTWETSRDDQGAIRSRVLKIYLIVTELGITPYNRNGVLELNNRYLAEYWTPHRIYIDSDNDIRVESFIHIPNQIVPVHAEGVWDEMEHVVDGFDKYFQELSQVLAQAEPAPTPSAGPVQQPCFIGTAEKE
ncbi:MAG: hypothetical protein AB1896_21055 [Thermodesulfobacteriota bacterium]